LRLALIGSTLRLAHHGPVCLARRDCRRAMAGLCTAGAGRFSGARHAIRARTAKMVA